MSEIYIGLNSGTSRDGIDACLFDFSSKPVNLLAKIHQPFPDKFKQKLRAIIEQKISWQKLGQLDNQLGQKFSEACEKLLNKSAYDKNKIKAIGIHGQTIYHQAQKGISIQLGNPFILASKLNIPVISNFRAADLAYGGQAAPLSPIFHHYLFSDEVEQLKPQQILAVINIGGIANISLLTKDKILGYDIGPGNTYLDYCSTQYFNQAFDDQGKIARFGKADEKLFDALLTDSYFYQPPPKSTGIEYFSIAWFKEKVKQFGSISAQDLLCTVSHLTAFLLAKNIPANTDLVWLSGGGSENQFLIELMRFYLEKQSKFCIVQSINTKLNWQAVECGLFAYLAKCYLEKKKIDLRSITGSQKALLLGCYIPAN